MSQHLIFALHGYLGQSKDWQSVQTSMQKLTQESITWVTPDLFSNGSLPIQDSETYVSQLMSQYLTTIKESDKKIFIGYSLGGRLGLMILKNYSNVFDHFVFLSTNASFLSVVEKESRLKADRQWASKINNENWAQFLTEWNSQAVLKDNLAEPVRLQKDYDLYKLKAALHEWSLGTQSDFSSVITRNQKKITWVVGLDDSKYLLLAEDLKQKKILLNFNRIFSSHRILFKNPNEVAILLHQLL